MATQVPLCPDPKRETTGFEPFKREREREVGGILLAEIEHRGRVWRLRCRFALTPHPDIEHVQLVGLELSDTKVYGP